MSALLEFDCRVPVGGYEVITVEKPYTEDDDTLTLGGVVVGVEKWRILQPRSERTRRFDLFSIGQSPHFLSLRRRQIPQMQSKASLIATVHCSQMLGRTRSSTAETFSRGPCAFGT